MNICKERLQAKEQNLPHYFTGKPCKRGHVSLRRTSDTRCLECSKEQAAKYRSDHAEEVSERSKQVREDNGDFIRERERRYYNENLEDYRKSGLKYRKKNRKKARRKAKEYYDANAEHCREVRREYARNNRGHLNALEAKRHARKLQATPAWASHDAMVRIYEECKKLTDSTGIKHNVDHIVPLQSDVVCGLHCEDNLQILTKEDNLKKSNTHEHLRGQN